MLSHIHIRDFAIIEHLDLELSRGLTVITGETGAGKSIMIDAIGLVLGDRADASVVRAGADRTEISVTVDADRPEFQQWLTEHDLDLDPACILRRTLNAEGRSRAYINGSAVTANLLKELGEQFVNIHGQHDHQALLAAATQRTLLDHHAQLRETATALRIAYRRWKQAERHYLEAQQSQQAYAERLEWLRFQTHELAQLGLAPGELETLEENLRRHAHLDRLVAITNEASGLLVEAEDQSAHRQLTRVMHLLNEAGEIDSSFQSIAEFVGNARIQLDEAFSELRRLRDRLDADPGELERLESRLAALHDVARKHRIPVDGLPGLESTFLEELARLEGPEFQIETLERTRAEAAQAYDALAAEARQRRQRAADELSREITSAMQGLGMQGGRFEVSLRPLPAHDRREYGTEDIEFLVSANPGQPLRAVAKVASGGELSRISLAIQLIAARSMELPTMIFDEVDSGIGGAVADTVGLQLRQLGERCQVFCVTHLPQVAAYGHHHLQVRKRKSAESTSTELVALDPRSRVEELARMLGGAHITEQTRRHAEEMLRLAQGAPVA
ncbi:MAG: DNA repair protein RecN [Thiotrichales bacterium]